jgi:hypothetical protein
MGNPSVNRSTERQGSPPRGGDLVRNVDGFIGVKETMLSPSAFKCVVGLLWWACWSSTGFSCSCGTPGPACSYVSTADLVFVGTPVYTNDDGSGKFTQETLYRFAVNEIFKGLTSESKEVWIDPGSFTSCYADYQLGKKYLVFANKQAVAPVDSSAMTFDSVRNSKHVPSGFKSGTPVYYAPECNGTRLAETAAKDIEWLRAWRREETTTTILGEVTDDFGFPIKGVEVSAERQSKSLKAVSGVDGRWSLDGVDPGRYQIAANLSQYHLRWSPVNSVQSGACVYDKLRMAASGAISGVVLDSNRRPIGNVELQLARVTGTAASASTIPRIRSLSNGSFTFGNLAEGDYQLGTNLSFPPSVDNPYEKTYLPAVHRQSDAQVIHLAPGQRVAELQLQLPRAIPTRLVRVYVTWPDGTKATKGEYVYADSTNGFEDEAAQTDSKGAATLRLLTRSGYNVWTQVWLSSPGKTPIRRATSPRTRLDAGAASISLPVILNESKPSGN